MFTPADQKAEERVPSFPFPHVPVDLASWSVLTGNSLVNIPKDVSCVILNLAKLAVKINYQILKLLLVVGGEMI